MPYNDQFEENIRQRFSGARMEPSPDLWKRLETQLPTQERKRIIPFWKSAALLAIAAAFALIVYSAVSSPPSTTVDLPHSEMAEAGKPTSPLEPKQEEAPVETKAEVVSTETSTSNPNKASQSRTIAQVTSKHNGDRFEAPGENNELGPVMGAESDLYIKTRLPKLSLVKPDLAFVEQLVSIPELNIPQTQWGINSLRVHDLDNNKPGKKGLFTCFVQGGSRRSGLGSEEVALIANPNPYTNQGAYTANVGDLPVQKNLYPQWVSSATVGGELFLTDNISMQAGIGVSNFSRTIVNSSNGERSEYLSALQQVDISDPTQPVFLTDERVVSANQLNHTALNIPVGLNLYAGNSKRAIAVQAEVLYQPVLTSPDNELNRAAYDFAELASTGRTNLAQTQVDNDLLNQHALSGRIGVRFQQRIGKSFHVYGGPGLSYALNPAYSSSSAGFDQKNLGLGFEMGVKWQQLR